MKRFYSFLVFVLVLSLLGCESLMEPVRETSTGYEIQKGTNLAVILQTPLSSNANQRGDTFVTQLKNPLKFKDKVILPKTTQIRGLVKRATKFEKLGDRSNLLLLFDQIVLPDGKKIPLVASLDTNEGNKVVKIQGKELKDAAVIVGSGAVGALVGKGTLGKDGAQKGLIIGVGAGTGAVMLSNMREVKLPQGAELTIKLDEPLLILKSNTF